MKMYKVVISFFAVLAVTILGGCSDASVSSSQGAVSYDTVADIKLLEHYRAKLTSVLPAPKGTIEFWIGDSHFRPRPGSVIDIAGQQIHIHDGRGEFGPQEIRIELFDVAVGTTTRSNSFVTVPDDSGNRDTKSGRGAVAITEIDETKQTVSGMFAFVVSTPVYYTNQGRRTSKDTVYGMFTKLSSAPRRALRPHLQAILESARTNKRLDLHPAYDVNGSSESGGTVYWGASFAEWLEQDIILHHVFLSIDAVTFLEGEYPPSPKASYVTHAWFNDQILRHSPMMTDPNSRIVITHIDSTNWCFEGTFDIVFASADTTEKYRIFGTFRDISIP